MSLLAENAAHLKEFASDGLDLSVPRAVEFAHVFTTPLDVDGFAAALLDDDGEVDILEPEDDGDPWEVAVTYELIPSAEAITAIEERLDALAQAHNGESDGWGLYEDE